MDKPCRAAVLSMHTSPLEQPGEGDSGGMNVYIRQTAVELAARGVASDIFTRRASRSEPEISYLADGVRVIAVPAGPPEPVSKDKLPRLVDEYAAWIEAWTQEHGRYDVLHAHYWLSGEAGARLKDRLGVPLVVSFHTLARVKDAAGTGEDPEPMFRTRGEARVVAAADRIVAATDVERGQLVCFYAADPSRLSIVPPGVDPTVFHPSGRADARARFGFGDRPTIVFAGRLQPLKGAHIAVSAMARLRKLVPDARLVIAGGDSPRGRRGERLRLYLTAKRNGVVRRVEFMEPLPHEGLADLYRAADVVVIPSATESFGLVALEAAACGTPVVATAVGGLRRLVHDGETGYLVDRRTPGKFARALSRVLADRATRERLGANAARLAAAYPWSRTAEGLVRTYRSVMACPDRRKALAAV